MITSLKYTHSDLLLMPDDGKRREIIDGDLFVTPPPVNYHQPGFSLAVGSVFKP
jgi:hypothetical protein